MNKLVIHTQYKENYGAHDWDGNGECPQYWKFKGGSTYVVPNFKAPAVTQEVVNQLRDVIEYSNYGSKEYILDYSIVPHAEKVCEDWESPIQINLDAEQPIALRVIDNREDGWMRSEILEKTETWTMMPEGERKGYSDSFLMRDGDICNGQSDLKNWFDTCGQVEVV